MSTNGLLLPEKADEVADLHINTVTVTVNAIDPKIGSKIYSNVFYKGELYTGEEAFNILSENQLKGIRMLAERGVVVKVNVVLIPGVNDEHIIDIAKKVK
jgi:nitrogen fixation protein NifB